MSDETASSSSPTSFDGSLYPEIPRDAVQVGEQLGVGSFGSVYKGSWTQPNNLIKEVAMKKVFMLQKEAEILSKVRHRNIIEFYGICKAETDFYIVTEFAENGSLYDNLHHDENIEINFETVLKWAKEIAAGIQYLHSDAVVTIIHRDLKSKNIVLDSKSRCKICDFGTSKDLTHSCTAPTWGGTAAWMSPEIITQKEGLTTASDVWSYGVVLWEMLSREIPYKDFTEFRIYTLITQQGVTLVIPDSCPDQLRNLMMGCWKMAPKERLTMRKILSELAAMEKCPETKQECQMFMHTEDWKKDIEQQKREIEQIRRLFEKEKEKFLQEKKAFQRRVRQESALLDAVRDPPPDVSQWNEQHTVTWIGKTLKTDDHKFLEKVKTAVCRHRITGARLLEMTQRDFEFLGVNKLGCRMQLMGGVKRLREAHSKFVDFPTLEQANKLQLFVKPKEEFPSPLYSGVPLVLMLGFYPRPGATTTRLKFYIDVDWDDDEPSTSTSGPSKLIQTACFTVLDDITNKPLNEPACYSGYSNWAMEWITKPDNIQRIRVIVNIHYADNVSEPRSTELVAVVTNFDRPSNLIERRVRVKTGRRSSITPVSSGIHHTISSPLLRGVWQKKATEKKDALLENEIASINSALIAESNKSPVFSLAEETTTKRSTSRPRRKRGQRSRTESASTDTTKTQNKPTENQITKVHGGKSKWCWKSQQSRNLH